MFFASLSLLQAQQRPNSPVLKSYVPSDARSFVLPGDAEYELWQNFSLVRKANDGDPIAQHELGIRYISGRGFTADTVKAGYWIGKAAAQKLPSACYNLAILQSNGWGVPWNPFEAFHNVQFAAMRDMPEALYVLGLFYLDNLIIPRNETEAYCFVQAAADSGYVQAIETMITFEQRGIGKRNEESKTPNPDPSNSRPPVSNSSKVIFLDFNRDTTSHTNDSTLIQELFRDGSETLSQISSQITHRADSSQTDTLLMREAENAAEAGSPEALTMLGRWHEEGQHMRKDIFTASLYYLRAIRFDSPRAPELLWHLIHEPGYFEQLKSRIDRNDADAQFIWASLIALQFDFQLTASQAAELLNKAVNQKNVQAIIELGLWHIQGRIVPKDRQHAIALWKRAENRGSREAAIRVAVTHIMSAEASTADSELISTLRAAARSGSVLAQVAIGYCYEHGFGLPQHAGEAARLYRAGAQRGSTIGFNALKRMYDRLRPKGKEFRVEE